MGKSRFAAVSMRNIVYSCIIICLLVIVFIIVINLLLPTPYVLCASGPDLGMADIAVSKTDKLPCPSDASGGDG